MAKVNRETVKEHLFWAYSNLAMAHSAVKNQQSKYGTLNYMIRAKLYKGLMSDSMNIRTFFDDEKIKLSVGSKCNYCDSEQELSLDHILPKNAGGKDAGDNLVYSCKKCNSSKGKKDLMEWMAFRGEDFLPLMIIRRYLKLCITYCVDNNIMEMNLAEIDKTDFPFKLRSIPHDYPTPDKLRL